MVDRITSRRVLLIEDDREAREALRMLLERCGHAVEEADDGLDGISLALRWRPDVAVVDIDMPIFNGYEVARQLRESLGDGVALIALTGLSVRDRAIEAGFDKYLHKPTDAEHVAYAVQGAQ